MADVTRLKNRARREEQRENWSRAIELYTQALSESQKKGSSVADLSLYNRIGDIYLRIGQKNTAVRYYEEAIERYAEQEFHASAIALCNKVLRIHPGRSSVFLQLGRLHLATNLIADAVAHYHRYAESMWELGEEAAAFDGLEELIEHTGDAKSVDVWARWWKTASDRAVAEARIDEFRNVAAAHDFDIDDLLARARSAESRAPAAEQAMPEAESTQPGVRVETSSEYDSEEDAPPLPLLDDSPIDADDSMALDSEEDGEPSQTEIGEYAIAETSGDEGGTIPWELEDDEGEFAVQDSEAPGVPATDDWGPAVELGEIPDPLATWEFSTLGPSLDSLEPGGVDSLAFESGVGSGARDGNESLVLHPQRGPDTVPLVAWYDVPEVGPELCPPSPSHGGYSSESPEHMAHQAEVFREAPANPMEGCEAPVSIGHPTPSAEPPTTWAHRASSPAHGIDLDSVEAAEVGLAGHASIPFRAEAGERAVDDEFPLDELVDETESLATGDAGASRESPAADGLPLEREEPIARASSGEEAANDSTSRLPTSLDAESVETEPTRPQDLESSTPSSEVDEPAEVSEAGAVTGEESAETPTPGARPEAGEELESSGATVDALEEDLASVRESGSEEAGSERVIPEGSEQSDDETLAVDEVATALDEVSTGVDEVAIEVEEVAWPAEPSSGRAADETEAHELPVSPVSAAPESTIESEAASAQAEPMAVPERAPSLEEAKRLLDAADPPRRTRGPEGLPAGGSGIEVARGEREDAFREWVRSASPQVLWRALTELELRAEVDKGLLVVERLVALDPDEPELLQKRLEYASALGNDAVVLETHISLGQSLERAGRMLEARKAYESLLALDPDHAIAREAVQRLEGVADRPVEQEEGVALAHPRESMHGATPIGEMANTSGYRDLAGSPALEAPPGKPLPYSGVAGGREAAADFEQLLSEFRAELHERPQQSDSGTRTELGASLKEMGRLDDAIRELQAAVREPQAPPMAYELLGEAFLDKGQARVAMRLLRQALQGSNWDEREMLGVLYQLGVAYQELGESSNALGCYERIFSVDIDYKDVQERIVSCS